MISITSPYNYSDLSRVTQHGKRYYQNPWGDPVPSVTTILDKTKPPEAAKALREWRERVGHEEASRITNEAASIGTQMHDMMESWVKQTEYTGTSTLQARLMAEVIQKNIEPHISEVWGSKVNLCYPQLYAGTTDLVGVYKGKPTIMDYKQANKAKKKDWIHDYFIQGCMYAAAHNELYGTDIKDIAIFMCTRDLEWLCFEISGSEFDYFMDVSTRRIEQFYDQNK